MTTRERYPIVGMFYRPPAKAFINVLAIGTPLIIRAEPDNQTDPNAVAVWLRTSYLGEAALAELDLQLGGFGYKLADVLAREEWHLGYIPKEMAAELRASGRVLPGADYDATFLTNPAGAPRVAFAESVE